MPKFVVHFKISSTFCVVDDSLFEFHIPNNESDIVAIFNTCQSNCILLLSLLFFFPAIFIKVRKAFKRDDMPLAYMPLIRMSNSLTSRFHNTGDSSSFYGKRLRSSEYYLLLLINSIILLSWIFMSYGHIFSYTHKVMKNNPMSISKFTVLVSQVVQWLTAILYLIYIRRKNYAPSFNFLKTFYIIQCFLTIVETFFNKADNNIWDKYNIRDTYFVVQCVIIFCTVLLMFWSITAYFDENDIQFDLFSCCKTDNNNNNSSGGEFNNNDNNILTAADKYYRNNNNNNSNIKTPRTIRKRIAGRATPEKDLWGRFHNVTREVSNDLTLPSSPHTSICEQDEMFMNSIRYLYADYCKLRGSGGNNISVDMFYDNSGLLQFTKSDVIDDKEEKANVASNSRNTRASSISHIYLSSENIANEQSFQDMVTKFTCKTVLQTMIESLNMSPLHLTLDDNLNSPLYVSANWQTSERLIVIVPSHLSKYPGIWSIRNCIANGGLSYGSMLLLLEQCIEDGDGVIILNTTEEYHMLPEISEQDADAVDNLKAEKISKNNDSNNSLVAEEENLQYQMKAMKKKLIADIERIMTIGNEVVSLEKLMDSLMNVYDEKLIKEQARAIRATYYQNYVHTNDDLQTVRCKIAWDILVQKSKANYITILAHRSSYGCAIKAYRYAKYKLAQNYRLNICAFVDGSKKDYLSFRSYMHVNPLSKSLSQIFVFDSERKKTPLITVFQSHARYTNENLIVFRFLKKNNNNDELRLLDYIYDNLEDNILYMEDEVFMWYVKRS